MADRIDVFLSSTSRDLTKFRARVKEVILAHGMFPIGMEEFQPTKDNALQKCYDELQNAEVFIGVYAHRYGYAPESHHTYTTSSGETRRGDGETGITHLEYLWAIERNLPMFLFVLADEDDEGEPIAWPLAHVEEEPGKSRLKAFKSHIMDRHVVKFFHSPDDLAAKVATALASLPRENVTKPPSRSDFYKHIPIPTNYVPRTELLAELRLALLGDDDVALTSAIKATKALHGMGGIGKSVMARALCDDPTVQAAFPDGILWATLGQEPDLSARLREWIHALDGTIKEGAPTIDSLKSTLAELLENRACLLIVDDVWQKKHGEAFRVGGEKCHLLLTTRDAELARGLGAAIHPIPTMSEAESIELLQEWADGNLAKVDRRTLKTITARLGRLPLAIKLAGAQLQRKSPEKWLERFDARKLEDRRGEADDPHSSLERCFGMSLSELKQAERKLYAALAIFKEDEPIREGAIARLWSGLDDLDEDDAQDLLDDLAARALLEVAGDAYPRAAILHDLLRDFMAAELGDPQAAHQALLDAYAETQTGDGWHTTPDDGYLYDHLGYHLKHAARIDEFHTLVTGSRDWMDVRYRQSYGDHGYVKDIDLLLEDYKETEGVERIIPHAQLVTARQVVNARVDTYTDEILEAMV